MIVDVGRRDGTIAVLVEGRALTLLSRLVEGAAAWAQRRDQLAEIADARSALYTPEPPPVAPAPPDEELVSCR